MERSFDHRDAAASPLVGECAVQPACAEIARRRETVDVRRRTTERLFRARFQAKPGHLPASAAPGIDR